MFTVIYIENKFSGKNIADELQNIIDGFSDEGGTIVFKKGRYVSSTVFLKSNVHIVFEDGAVVLGSENFDDYAPDEKVDYPLYQDASHSFFDCSLFVAKDCENVSITGNGVIDMRSVWDEKNVRDMAHRGAKCIAFKNCRNVVLSDFSVKNCTDLAVYFAGCENIEISRLSLRVYIDGISPDNSKNVRIKDCKVESGDDGIVFKSSYTLNRPDYCKDITVENCRIKSRCNAIKFGTETNGGFFGITVRNCYISDTRISGIAVESVDGAIVDGLTFSGIKMRNVGTPFFVHLGERLRGPKGSKTGSVKNVRFENITATGPYKPYRIIEWNYDSFLRKDTLQIPQIFGKAESFDGSERTEQWQITSNVCGLKGHNLKNISFSNINLKLYGAVDDFSETVPEKAQDYPEVYVYGRILPAKGVFFRHVEDLYLDNFKITTYNKDTRPDFVFCDVTFSAKESL